MPLTKSKGQKCDLDKFYTDAAVAAECIAVVGTDFDVIIEPSAGNGAFSNQIPGCIAMDIAPGADGIIEQDWFEYRRLRNADESVLVIGNPPFGKQNNLALAFINHAARFADKVAFILPLSFMRKTMQDRVTPNLHLVLSQPLKKGAFLLDGEPYNAPSVFQVWEHREQMRVLMPHLKENSLFEYTRNPLEADIRIQRVGSRAGEADTDLTRAASSNYFGKVKSPFTVEQALDVLSRVEFPDKKFGVGPPFINQFELNAAVDGALSSTIK